MALIVVAVNYHICHEAHLFEIGLKTWPISYQPTLHMPIQHYLLREQIKGRCYITINGELGQSSGECQIIMYLWSTLIWKDPMRASKNILLFILLPISKLVESYVKVEKLGKIWDKIQETHQKFSADPKNNLTLVIFGRLILVTSTPCQTSTQGAIMLIFTFLFHANLHWNKQRFDTYWWFTLWQSFLFLKKLEKTCVFNVKNHVSWANIKNHV